MTLNLTIPIGGQVHLMSPLLLLTFLGTTTLFGLHYSGSLFNETCFSKKKKKKIQPTRILNLGFQVQLVF